MPRGPFLSLDGVDGTGKSTQCRWLAERLRAEGRAVTECADPGGTVVGDLLRDVLLHQRNALSLATEALLFMASRAQLTAEIIRPALDASQVVVADRYLLANVVYQGHAGGLDPRLLWEVGQLATGGLEPDLTLVLDVPLEVARARRRRPADRVESRDGEFHARVRAGFLAEARRRPDLVQVIDATGSAEDVRQLVWQRVSEFLDARGATP